MYHFEVYENGMFDKKTYTSRDFTEAGNLFDVVLLSKYLFDLNNTLAICKDNKAVVFIARLCDGTYFVNQPNPLYFGLMYSIYMLFSILDKISRGL